MLTLGTGSLRFVIGFTDPKAAWAEIKEILIHVLQWIGGMIALGGICFAVAGVYWVYKWLFGG